MNSSRPASLSSSAGPLQVWRERFLRIILRGTVVFGLVALLPTLLTNTDPGFFVIYGVAYVALLVVALAPLSYSLRAWTFISLFFLLGLSGLLDTGIWGDARIFFISMTFVTAMLISPRTAISVSILTVVASSFAAWLALSGGYALSTRDMPVGNLATWLSGIGTIIMLDAVIIIGFDLLQKEFTRAEEQAAASLGELELERRHLEQRVEERTRESMHKTAQLEAASLVSRRIAGLRELDALLADIVQAIADQFSLLHAGIFLLDEDSRYAILQAASSEAGKRLVETGFRIKVGPGSLVGAVAEHGRGRIAPPIQPGSGPASAAILPGTRSQMVLPLIARERIIGALDVHSGTADAFAASDMEVMQSLTDQLATAIENARLFSEREALIAQFRALIAAQSPDAWRSFLRGRHPVYQYTSSGVRPVSATTLNGGARSLLIPLVVRGSEIGAVHLRRREAAPDWTPREQDMAREIAAQVALALENARLFEETTRRASLERLTSEISARINSSTLSDTIMRTAAEELSRALGGTEVLVQIQTPHSGNGSVSGDDTFTPDE